MPSNLGASALGGVLLVISMAAVLSFAQPLSNYTAPAPNSVWTRLLSSSLSPRAFVSSAFDATKNRVYMYGGADGPVGVGTAFNDLWIFDLATGRWSVLPTAGAMLQPRRTGCMGGTASLIGSSLILYGGQDDATLYGKPLIYDLTLRTLIEQEVPATAQFPPERFQHASFTRNNKMYVFGGSSQSAFSNDLWEYTPGSATTNAGGVWLQVDAGGTPPPPTTNPTTAYVDSSSMFYVWHGQYEPFNKVDDPTGFMYQFNIDTKQWRKLSMQAEDINLNATAFQVLLDPCTWVDGSNIYMFGGINVNETLSSQVYKLDSLTPTSQIWIWRRISFNVTNPLGIAGVSADIAGRYGHECHIATSGIPFLSLSGPAVLVYGGLTSTGPTIEMLALSLVPSNSKWVYAKATESFPVPRANHASTFISSTIYLFGGQSASGSILSDFWSANLNANVAGNDVASADWAPVLAASMTQPGARRYSAMSSLFGVLVMFGGLGPQLGSVPNILSDLWVFYPISSMWIQPQVSGAVPLGRYGHTVSSIGSKVWMFGGILASGQSSEMWSYDVVSLYWTSYAPAFTGAMWSVRRAFHTSSVIETFVTADILSRVKDYIANVSGLAYNLLHTAPSFMFPPALADTNDPIEEFIQLVTARVNRTIQILGTLKEGSVLQFVAVYGGNSDDAGGGASSMGDLMLFDTCTELWHPPGNFDAMSDFMKLGRSGHIARGFGEAFMVQGGSDDFYLKSPAPMVIPLSANGMPGFSFPYSSFKWSNAYKLYGPPTDAFNGGAPPTPQALAPSMILSMPAFTFSSMTSWKYLGESNFSVFYNQSLKSLAVPSSLSSPWSTVQMNTGGNGVKIGDSIFITAGIGAVSGSTAPIPVATFPNIRLTRGRFSPVCYRTGYTLLPQYHSGIRQLPMLNSTSVCFMCGAGSRLNTTTNVCDLCLPGHFSEISGAVNCTPCPAGYFSIASGGNNIQTCAACPQGFFNPHQGSSSCVQCATGAICPAGSAEPQSAIASVSKAVIERQIKPIDSTAATMSLLRWSVIGGGVAIGVIIGILFLTAHFSETEPLFRFSHCDWVYNSAHSVFTKPRRLSLKSSDRWKELYETEWKTPLGGFCSLFFLGLALAIAVLLALPYKFDNVAESQTLLPALLLDLNTRLAIRTDLVFSLTIHRYGQSCLASAASTGVGACAAEIRNITTNLDSLPLGSTVPQAPTLQCTYKSRVCTVTFTCLSCKLGDELSQLVISMQQQQSFGQTMTWSLSATSGVQTIGVEAPGGQLSYVSHSISPPQAVNFFRGGAPTVVSIIASGSSYQSSVGTPGTGFVLTFVQETLGAITLPNTFQTVQGLVFAVNLTRSNAFFSTTQTARLDVVQTIAQISGAIAAVLYLVGAFMRLCENRCLDIKPGATSRKYWWKPAVGSKAQDNEFWYEHGPADIANDTTVTDEGEFNLNVSAIAGDATALIEMAEVAVDASLTAIKPAAESVPLLNVAPSSAPVSAISQQSTIATTDVRSLPTVYASSSAAFAASSTPAAPVGGLARLTTAAAPALGANRAPSLAPPGAGNLSRATTTLPSVSRMSTPVNFSSGGINATTQLRALSRMPLQPHVASSRRK